MTSWLSRSAMASLAFDHLTAEGVPTEPPSSLRVPTQLETNCEQLGALIAQTHNAFDRLQLPSDHIPAWGCDVDTLSGASPDWLDRTLHDRPDLDAVLRPWRERARELVSASQSSDVGLCHGEVYPRTMRLRGEGSFGVSELDWVGFGAREYDIATYRWVLAVHRPTDGEILFGQFLDGYSKDREPPVSQALRAWVAVRHLWSFRLGLPFEGVASFERRVEFARSWAL